VAVIFGLEAEDSCEEVEAMTKAKPKNTKKHALDGVII